MDLLWSGVFGFEEDKNCDIKIPSNVISLCVSLTLGFLLSSYFNMMHSKFYYFPVPSPISVQHLSRDL